MGKCPKELLDDMSIQKGAENPKLGEMLVRSGKITREQLREAIERQSILKKKLGEILVMMGLLTPDELRLYLVDQKWTDEIDLHDFKLDMGLMERVGKDFCWRQRMIPIEYYRIGSDKILSFAVGSKDDLTQIRQSERLRDLVLIPYIAPREQVEKLLEEIRRDIEGDNIFNLDDDDDINI
jgi:type IV pilus assembly protein PilB